MQYVVLIFTGSIVPSMLFMASRFAARLDRFETSLRTHGELLVALGENQKETTKTVTKIIDHAEEVEDVIDQLQLATHSLQERMKHHDEYLKGKRRLTGEV